MQLTEVWTPVKYFDRRHVLRTSSYFEISNKMRIRDTFGDLVTLDPDCYTGSRKKAYPSWSPDPASGRLVGLHQTCLWSFSSPPNAYTSHVDHINGDHREWTLENLRWSNPCLNHLNETHARGYQIVRRKHGALYRPWACCCGRAYFMDPVSSPDEAHELYVKIRADIYNKVKPWFYAGRSLLEVRDLLEGWAPKDAEVKEFSYGQWHPNHKRRRSSDADTTRPCPIKRVTTPWTRCGGSSCSRPSPGL